MALTDTALKKAKPGATPRKLTDGAGLYLLLNPNGSRWWRLDYRFAGKRKTLSMGTYPDTSLKVAREKRDEARQRLAVGVDPGAHRQAMKRLGEQAAANTFASIAAEWLTLHAARMAPVTLDKARWMLEELANPWLGPRPITEIDAPEMLMLLRRIEARGARDTAHRVRQRCSQIFRFAIATGRARHDPTLDLRGALAPTVSQSHAAITDPRAMGELLRAIEGYRGNLVTCSALKLAPLVFVRPGELRRAEWSEIDFEQAQWRIPAAKMKMREEHVVPLSSQALAILRELQPLTGRGDYVFPGVLSAKRPISENTLNAALRRLGFEKDVMTPHGFRAMASTRLHELGYPPDVIERQLAHAERNKVRAAYNRAQHLIERTAMMQAWADHLDGLRGGMSARR